MQKGKIGETYNIGGNNEWANIDIINLLCATIDNKLDTSKNLRDRFPTTPMALGRSSSELIEFVEDRRGHDRRYAINPDKAFKELGYKPSETFETGIVKTIEWYLENSDWWEPLRRQ